WPALHGRPTPEEVRNVYVGLWRPLLEQAAAADNTLILRDYHSPNLMWLPERTGFSRSASSTSRTPSRARPLTILCLFCRTPASMCPKRLKPSCWLATVPPEAR